MTPYITYHFTAESPVTDQVVQVEETVPVDTTVKTVSWQLALSGYSKVTFVKPEWEKWAWPGGYPIYYVCKDGGCLCADCCNKEIALTTQTDDPQWHIVAADINYEDDSLVCDHCGKNIESAYGGPDDSTSDAEALASAGHGTDEDYGSAEDVL